MNLRYRIHKNGTASIHGIPETYLSDIITMAWLYNNDRRDKYKEQDGSEWIRCQQWILDRLHKLRGEEVDRFNSAYFKRKAKPEEPLKQRLLKRKKERDEFEKIWREIFSNQMPIRHRCGE
jgi:hypothetical protein